MGTPAPTPDCLRGSVLLSPPLQDLLWAASFYSRFFLCYAPFYGLPGALLLFVAVRYGQTLKGRELERPHAGGRGPWPQPSMLRASTFPSAVWGQRGCLPGVTEEHEWQGPRGGGSGGRGPAYKRPHGRPSLCAGLLRAPPSHGPCFAQLPQTPVGEGLQQSQGTDEDAEAQA